MGDQGNNSIFMDFDMLKIDCEKCSGLCCVALCYMKTDGFPDNKAAGVPCKYLGSNYRCDIHSKLAIKNMKGCLAYDCFGAGQKVTQDCYPGLDWRTTPDKANDIFAVFLTVLKIQQMRWYLVEAWSLIADRQLKAEIAALISESEYIANQRGDMILHIEIDEFRAKANLALKKTSDLITTNSSDPKGMHRKDYFAKNFKKANLSGRNFSMALLIAANLEGCNLQEANFLGVDMRDANIKNTDLSSSVFLTQMQINSAKGNSQTHLPVNLSHPRYW